MSDRLLKESDAIKVLAKILYEEPPYLNSEEKCMAFAEKELSRIPTIEPNLILPERMERGECYEVGETIVVMNHDDYYDLLCRAMENEPKQGEWIEVTNGRGGHECSYCHAYAPSYMNGDEHLSNYCPSCGARMFPTQMLEI